MNLIFRRNLILKNSLLFELKKTYGLAFFKSVKLLNKYGLHKHCIVKELSPELLVEICKEVETNFLADVDLKKSYMSYVRRSASFKNHHAMFLRMALKKEKDDTR